MVQDQPSSTGPAERDFLWIKQRLDPKASYVVFEHKLKGESIFDPGHRIYDFLAAEGLSWQQVVDLSLSVEYLVVQVAAGDEDRILGRVLGLGLPENVVFYLFKAKEV